MHPTRIRDFKMDKRKLNFGNVVAGIICLAVAGMVFSGCKEEKNPDNPSGNGTDTIGNNNTTKWVSKMTINGTDVFNYTYDAQNRLIGVNYNGNSIVVTYPNATTAIYDAGVYGKKFITAIFNSEGYVAQVNLSDGTITVMYEYENGYLKKTTYSDKDGTTAITTHTWKDGNLVSTQEVEGWDTSTYNYTYGKTLNKESNFVFHMPTPTPSLDEESNAFMPRTWFGKQPQYLLSNYRYETNSSGYVTKVYEQGNGGTESLFVEYQYK